MSLCVFRYVQASSHLPDGACWPDDIERLALQNQHQEERQTGDIKREVLLKVLHRDEAMNIHPHRSSYGHSYHS